MGWTEAHDSGTAPYLYHGITSSRMLLEDKRCQVASQNTDVWWPALTMATLATRHWLCMLWVITIAISSERSETGRTGDCFMDGTAPLNIMGNHTYSTLVLSTLCQAPVAFSVYHQPRGWELAI